MITALTAVEKVYLGQNHPWRLAVLVTVLIGTLLGSADVGSSSDLAVAGTDHPPTSTSGVALDLDLAISHETP